ncbi:hypothetical protein BAE44_0022811 [Dichanthelium oligosanthes]|uniref:Uncharacterized protein n=1 Tax=Dichanthelium oligosanthes TaxID=888268 RepID=A0A1E5UTD6_9POAL|nr:hypothetical protein BAE44_0022811 [Dichanthelium oligosanthes]
MRGLTVTSVFSVQHRADGGELVYGLSPYLTMMFITTFVTPFLCLGDWFQHEMPDPSPFKMTHGLDIWDLADHDASFEELFDKGMVLDIVVRECRITSFRLISD